MQDWLANHLWFTFIAIFIMLAYVYNKVFRTRKLPLLKNLIVYVLIAVGALLLMFFQLMGLPIVLCLGVAILLMVIVRIRLFLTKKWNK